MKITEISIKNFRSFDERGVSIVVGEMTAFVGKNSSGKSNILQALQLFWGQYALAAEDFYYGETDRTISVSVLLPLLRMRFFRFYSHMFLQMGFFSCAMTIQKWTLRGNYILVAKMSIRANQK